MARVVVTGGAGFLGSHLCRALLDRGDDVVAIDNFVTGTVANVEGLFGRRGFTLVEHDVSSYLWVPGDVDVVMHLASPASPVDFERIPIQILKVGGLGTHNGLGLAKAKGATFFLASTSEVYGDPLVHPQPETYWGNVNPIGPRGVYDEAKRYAEAMTTAYHRHHHLDVRIVRIFNSILADEQVLYDDGVELRRERIGDLADRIGHEIASDRLLGPGVRRGWTNQRVRGHGPRRACSDWPVLRGDHTVRTLDSCDRRPQPVRGGSRWSTRCADRVGLAGGRPSGDRGASRRCRAGPHRDLHGRGRGAGRP